jgi:hypothetical protein
LEACGYEAVDVVTNRNENLSCEMAAFLAAMKLVFKVNTCGAVLSKKLCELNDC